MVWKPKEPELTVEQALQLAKKELAPFWIGSPPLFAAVKTGNEVRAYPIQEEFARGSWFLFFVDLTFSRGELAIACAKEWHRRYAPHGVEFLLVYEMPYAALRERAAVEQTLRSAQVPFPAVIDFDGNIARAFGVRELPHVALYAKGRAQLERKGEGWMSGLELELQRFLRSDDPGLSLLPVLTDAELGRLGTQRDHSSFELGRARGMAFPKPGFTQPMGAFIAGHFGAGERPEKMKPGQLFLRGNWLQDGDRIATADPHAELGFRATASGVSIVAQKVSKGIDPCKLVVEVNGAPAFDAFAAEDLAFDDEGQSFARVEIGRLYHLLAALGPDEREITLRFPYADHVSIALYAIRFIWS